MFSKTFCSRAALVAVTLLPAIARAQAGAAPQALVMMADNLQGADARHRDLAAQRGGVTPVMPGDTVHYRLTFTNVQRDSVRNVQFNDPLPAGLQYAAGSARADRNDVAVAFSIDGGKSFSAQPMIEEQIDGRTVRTPAPASMYTHVRWTLRGWVQPGAHVTAEFNAHLAADTGVKP